MARVSTIDVHNTYNISADFVAGNISQWMNLRFDDFKVCCFATTVEQAARFKAIAEAIAAVNAEFDAKASAAGRAAAEAAFTTIAAE